MPRLPLLACCVLLLTPACREKAAPPPPPPVLAAPTAPPAAPATPAPGPAEKAGRCAMCGMDVSQHPDWVGAIDLPDGSVRFGCSVRCTLGLALHSAKFLNVEPGQLKRVRVPDYLHPGTLLEAPQAFFVVDSDVKGPMGVELVPAATEADAQTIVQRHGGRVLRHAEVTVDVLRNLKEQGKSAP